MAAALSVSLAVWVVWNPMSSVFVILERWLAFLVFASIRLIAVVLCGFVLYTSGHDAVVTLAGMTLGGSIVQVAGVAYVLWSVKAL